MFMGGDVILVWVHGRLFGRLFCVYGETHIRTHIIIIIMGAPYISWDRLKFFESIGRHV